MNPHCLSVTSHGRLRRTHFPQRKNSGTILQTILLTEHQPQGDTVFLRREIRSENFRRRAWRWLKNIINSVFLKELKCSYTSSLLHKKSKRRHSYKSNGLRGTPDFSQQIPLQKNKKKISRSTKERNVGRIFAGKRQAGTRFGKHGEYNYPLVFKGAVLRITPHLFTQGARL